MLASYIPARGATVLFNGWRWTVYRNGAPCGAFATEAEAWSVARRSPATAPAPVLPPDPAIDAAAQLLADELLRQDSRAVVRAVLSECIRLLS